MTSQLYSTSTTPASAVDAYELVPDSGTSTPKQQLREQIGPKLAAFTVAVTMLTSHGTSILAGNPSNIMQVVNPSALTNEPEITFARKPDTTTMNDLIAKPNLDTLFEFRDAPAVSSFLRDNPFLSDILLGAYYNAKSRFDKNTSLVLEVFSDPDEPRSDQLFLFIQTPLPAEQARERLRQLDREWWIAMVPTVRNKLTIDTELV